MGAGGGSLASAARFRARLLRSEAGMERPEVARILGEIAEMYELAGANRFKVRAYEKGAEALLGFTGDLPEAVRTGRLREVPGIGATIFANVESLVTTG